MRYIWFIGMLLGSAMLAATPENAFDIYVKVNLPDFEPGANKNNRWSLDIDNDNVIDEVLWLKNKKTAQNAFFLFTSAVEGKLNVQKLFEDSSDEKFCGTLTIKKAGVPSISEREYFQWDTTAKSLKRNPKMNKLYKDSVAIEISYSVPLDKKEKTWTEDCFCTTGYYWAQGKIQNAAACD